MTGLPIAHVGAIPIEETLASLGPATLFAFAVAWALRPVSPTREGATSSCRPGCGADGSRF